MTQQERTGTLKSLGQTLTNGRQKRAGTRRQIPLQPPSLQVSTEAPLSGTHPPGGPVCLFMARLKVVADKAVLHLVYSSAQAVVTKDHTPGGLNSRSVFSHSSGHQGVCWVGVSRGLSPWFVDGHLLLCLHIRPHTYLWASSLL